MTPATSHPIPTCERSRITPGRAAFMSPSRVAMSTGFTAAASTRILT